MHNWFYTLRGQKHGPVSLQEILEQVRTGAFDPKTEQLQRFQESHEGRGAPADAL